MSGDDTKRSSLIEDFLNFKEEKSLENRERLVKRICDQYGDHVFEANERKIVDEILGILSQDVEKTIRQLLAENLNQNEDLPRDIALKLASDEVNEVSTPILQFSKALTDLDLDMLITSTSEVAKLEAIASRDNLSEKLSDSLVEKEVESVNQTLINNKTASISDQAVDKILDKFHSSEPLMQSLINRGGLSIGLAERMVSLVSDELQKQIVEKYDVKPSVAKQTVASAREEMTLGMVSKNMSPEGTIDLVNHLFSSGKLSHSIVLRALCRGDIVFFETGMAKLAGIPVSNAKKLVRQGDPRGFSALFHAASMPPTMLEATETLLRIVIEDMEKIKKSSNSSQHLIERIVDNGYDKKVPNMSYFMALIGNANSEGAVTH